jgi:hypothetical protein
LSLLIGEIIRYIYILCNTHNAYCWIFVSLVLVLLLLISFVQTVRDGLGPVAEISEKHDAVKVFSVILLRIR